MCRNDACIDAPLNTITPAPEIVDFRYPTLMVDGIRGTSLPIAAYLSAFRRLKSLTGERNTTLLYCSGGLPCQLAVPVARTLGVPIICHFHHPATRRYRYLWLTPFADVMIFPSDFTRRHSIPDRLDRGRVLYNGIDLTRFCPAQKKSDGWRETLGIPPTTTVIGQVGALVANKRADFLVSAFKALRETTQEPLHLCLVGTGPMEAALRRQVSDLGLDGVVTLTGYVDDVLPYYQHVIDINVMASREEGLGIAVIEGSACALPAVVANCTGLPETVIENRTGLLFEVNDAEDLRRQLLRLVQSPALRATMGQAGRALAEERFSATAYDQGLMATVSDLLLRHAAAESPIPAAEAWRTIRRR